MYSCSNPFGLDEIGAWWTCYVSLQLVDGELRRVDALLAEMELPKFAARSIRDRHGRC